MAWLVVALCIAPGRSGCASTRPWTNEPLAAREAMRYIANFSGGGSRAAAFAHAVLRELDAAPYMWQRQETTLAREHLRRFPADFLETDIQRQLLRGARLPKNLHRLASTGFRRRVWASL